MRISALAVLMLAAASGLTAQEGTKWVNAQGAYVIQDPSSLKDDFGYGLGLGTWFTNRWGAEFSILNTDIEGKGLRSGLSGRETHGFFSGLMNLNPGGEKWFPFLRLGLGATQLAGVPSPLSWTSSDDTTTRINFHGGVGVQAHLAENFIGSLEARAVRVETQISRNEYQALVGLGYRWGGGRAAAPPPPPAPEPPKPVEEVKPVPPPPPAKIVLDEAVLHFANGKADLSPEGVAAVKKVAASLKEFKGNYTLMVSGHTSSVGSVALNKSLGKRRADAVAKILVGEGLPAAAVQTEGVGPDKPIADNKTKAGQAKNRRVEIDVKVKGQEVEVRKTETAVQGS